MDDPKPPGATQRGTDRGGWAERNRFGRIGRIPTPTPFPVGDINSYLILPPGGGGGLTLIDTGVKSPQAFEALRRGFKEFGCSFEDVSRILVTHAHMDHCGQALRLRELSGATVCASALEAEKMRIHWSPRAHRDDHVVEWLLRWGVPEERARHVDPHKLELARTMQDPLEVDEILGDGDTLAVGDLTLEAIDTPGHCEGHLVFYERDTRTLFSGDHLLTDITPVPLLSLPEDPGTPRPRSLVRFMRSLERVEALACDVAFPAHGDVIWDHRALIESYRLHHERRKLQLARYLRDGPLTAFEIAQRMFAKYVDSELFLVLSEVIGHVDVLEDEGQLLVEQTGGVERLRLAPGALGGPARGEDARCG